MTMQRLDPGTTAVVVVDVQERLAAINERLAGLGAKFGQNVLADEKNWALMLANEEGLAGLPDFLTEAMAAAACDRGEDGKYAVTLSRSIISTSSATSSASPARRRAGSKNRT